MTPSRKKLLAGAAVVLGLSGPVAWAAGMFGGWPFAGSLPLTMPLTLNEGLAADTQLPQGLNPASELISAGQLAAVAAIQQSSTATNTAAFTLTAGQMVPVSAGGRLATVLLTGTLTAGANITTLTGTQIATAVALVTPAANVVGSTYVLRLSSSGAGAFAWTVVGGVGVTVNGNAVIPEFVSASYLVTVTSLTTATLTYIGN